MQAARYFFGFFHFSANYLFGLFLFSYICTYDTYYVLIVKTYN